MHYFIYHNIVRDIDYAKWLCFLHYNNTIMKISVSDPFICNLDDVGTVSAIGTSPYVNNAYSVSDWVITYIFRDTTWKRTWYEWSETNVISGDRLNLSMSKVTEYNFFVHRSLTFDIFPSIRFKSIHILHHPVCTKLFVICSWINFES